MSELVRSGRLAPALVAVMLGACAPTTNEAMPQDETNGDVPAVFGTEMVPAQGTSAQTQSGRDTVSTAQSTIDWDSARRDLANRRNDGDTSTVQIESDGEAPPVPVLLPSGLVRPATAERPRYRGMSDGYFAKYPGLDYDLTVSGTNEWFSGGTDGRDAPAAEMTFTRTMTGAQVALNRYGAAYLLEFECNSFSGAQANECIDETEALDIASRLVITGSR